jgi:hypothetical protein
MSGQQQSQQQSQSARDALIGLYLWADMEWTRTLGRAFNRITAMHGANMPESVVGFMRRTSRNIVNTLDQQTPPLLNRLEITVRQDAVKTAEQRVPPKPPTRLNLLEPPQPPPFDFSTPLGVRATDAIHDDLKAELKSVRARILRAPDDLYKLTAAGAATRSVQNNGQTIRDAQQSMLTDLLTHGVTGFTDRAGRDWQLASYVEMAVRTATIRALNEAHMTVMQAAGIALFAIPVHTHSCPICHAWQGRILSLEPDPRAYATVEQAREAGLWHPNCEHTVVGYREGDRLTPNTPWTPQNERLWNASQRQRSLESRIRAQKRILLANPSADMRLAAKKRIRTYQSQLRALTNDTGLLRRRFREQNNLGLRA